MLAKNVVDEELKRGSGLSIKEIEPFLRAGGDAAEMKFMECCGSANASTCAFSAPLSPIYRSRSH
jgi:hypothetical protein